MAMQGQIRVEFGKVFPDGAYAAGPVEKVRDFERSRKDEVIQQLDKDSGLPLWVVEVIDAQNGGKKSARKTPGSGRSRSRSPPRSSRCCRTRCPGRRSPRWSSTA